MPSGIPCRPGHHAVWDAMPSGTPCRLGYHAVWDTMPSGMRTEVSALNQSPMALPQVGILCAGGRRHRQHSARVRSSVAASLHARSAARAPPAALDVARPRRGLPHSAPGRPLLCRVSAAPGLLALGSSGAANASAYPSPRQFGSGLATARTNPRSEERRADPGVDMAQRLARTPRRPAASARAAAAACGGGAPATGAASTTPRLPSLGWIGPPYALCPPARFFRCGQRVESLGLECTVPLWFCLAFPNHVLDTAVDQATMM